MMVEGSGMGLGVAVLGALRPCLNASRTQPVRALAPGDYEVDDQKPGRALWSWIAGGPVPSCRGHEPSWTCPRHSRFWVWVGIISSLGMYPSRSHGHPMCCNLDERRGLSAPRLPIMGTLAVEQIARSPGRNSVTLSALAIGLAILVGVGSMIGSFRHTVEIWIDQTIHCGSYCGSDIFG